MDKQVLDILQRIENKVDGIEKDINNLKQSQERIKKKLQSVHK